MSRTSPTDAPASRSASSSERGSGWYIASIASWPSPMPVSNRKSPFGCRMRYADTTTRTPGSRESSGMTKWPMCIRSMSSRRSISGARRRRSLPLRRPEARVERVAQRVAEEVEAEHRERDRDPRRDGEPRRALEELHAGPAEHEAPGGHGLGDAEAEERE